MITLNLISPQQKNFLKVRRIYLYFRNLCGMILTYTILIAIIAIIAKNSLNILAINYENQNYLDIKEKEIKKINTQLAGVLAIQGQFTPWSKMLLDIFRLIPANIQIIDLEINKKNQTIKIQGIAKTRNDYLNLLTTLENSPMIKEFDRPVENLLSKEFINFNLILPYQYNF
jgi:hypothetical protein